MTRPTGPKQTEKVAGIDDDIFYDPLTGGYYDMTPGTKSSNWDDTGSSGGGGGGGGWGGGGGGTIDYTDSDVRLQIANEYDLWMGDGWSASHLDEVQYALDRSWGASEIRMRAVDLGANGPLANAVWQYIRSQTGDIPASQVQALMRSGIYQSEDFEAYVAPQYSGSSILNNRQSDAYVTLWEQYTGGAPMSWTAEQKLQEIANTYGFTTAGFDAWEEWLPTTFSANAGEYGAQKRAVVTDVFTSLMHRAPTAEELGKESEWMNLVSGPMGNFNTALFVERIRATDEYQSLYQYKPATMTEDQWWATKSAYETVGNWYFGDTPFGGVGFQYTDQEIGQLITEDWTPSALAQYYTNVEEAAYDKGIYSPMLMATTGDSFTDAEWMTLASGSQGSGALKVELYQSQGMYQFREVFTDLYGREPTPGEYQSMSEQFVSPNQMARDFAAEQSAEELFPEVSELLSRTMGESVSMGDLKNMALGRGGSGALKAKIAEARRLDTFTEAYQDIYGSNPAPGDYAEMASKFSSGAQMKRDNEAQLWAEENYDKMSETLSETLGYSVSMAQLKDMALNRSGSGGLRALLVEAQGKLEFREAYRQVFGQENDPTPEDYERITNEFVSPAELIREYQAKNSAAQMYPEISELLKRVYGTSVTEEELVDMAIGREGTGDLKALINEAEKLDQYRWLHEQYYGTEPTPDDYAKYAGYSGPDELQWEIVTNERVGQYGETIAEDFKIGLGIDISAEDIRAMLGEQEGYGALQAQWTEAQKERKEAEQAEQASHQSEKVSIAYQGSQTGGFKVSLPGLENL